MSEISDSESDSALPVSAISRATFSALYRGLPAPSRSAVGAKIRRTRYQSLVDPENTSDAENPPNPLADHDPHTDHELQRAIETLRPLETRRGLRKRNFASTHPYLTDMAHWLGIASANYLNDVYEQNHEVRPILKLLNSEYLRKKKKYPSEDRYKWKSFYKLIGKSHPQYAMPDEAPKSSDPPSDSSDSESDLNVSRARSMVIVDSDDDNDPSTSSSASSDSSSGSDIVVRVGGRELKERSALRGVLPESAKRLNLWKAPKKSYKPRRLEQEKRKGLAVKKKSSHHSARSAELDHFIDEAGLYSEVYGQATAQAPDHDLEALQHRSEAFDHMYNDYISVSTGSDSELPLPLGPSRHEDDSSLNDSHVYEVPSPRVSSNAAPRHKSPALSPRPSFTEDFYMGEAMEARDEIDRQFTYSGTRRAQGGPKKSGTKRARSSGPRNPRPLRYRKASFSGSSASRASTSSLKRPRKQKSRMPIPKPVEPHKPTSNQTILSDYYFRRDPVASTIVFEAESQKRFVKPIKHLLDRGDKTTFQPQNNELLQYLDHIHTLDHQRYDFGLNSSQIIKVGDHKYTLSLLNKEQSRKDSVSYLSRLLRTVKLNKHVPLEELIESLKGYIRWQLVLQEDVASSEKEYLEAILGVFKKIQNHPLSRIRPLLLLVHYIWLKFSQRSDSTNTKFENSVKTSIAGFWRSCLDSEQSVDDLLIDDDFHLVFSISKHSWPFFWRSIELALEDKLTNPLLTLHKLFAISLKSPQNSYDWACYYKLFDTGSADGSSEFAINFITVCFSLSQRRNWPLQEKLIIKLYSTVTRHRFFNFEDEPNPVVLFGKIHTVSDLPETTFFDKFINLLYYYFSTLDDVTSAKRLALKMMISSQYVYQKNIAHQAAFANRMNFVILLSQLSEVNQSGSIISLIKSIIDSQDIDLYHIAIKQLASYCEIIRARVKQFPVEAFEVLINKIIALFPHLPGMTKIWVSMYSCLKKSLQVDPPTSSPQMLILLLDIINRVNLNNVNDDIGFKLIELLEGSTIMLPLYKDELLRKGTLISSIVDKITSFLHQQLGRFPMQSSVREKRLNIIVERCISVWCNLISISADKNWNKMILSDFPYIGNSYSREVFGLCLLSKILEHTKIPHHRDLVLMTLLKSLAAFNTSPYISSLMNALKSNNEDMVDLRRIHVNNKITTIEVESNKTQITLAVLSNICDGNMREGSKSYLIESFVIALNDEYDKHYLSPRFVDACKKLIEYIEVYCADYIKNSKEERELARKLGITPVDSSRLKWRTLTRVGQLSFLHSEFVSGILHKQDVFNTLNQYLDMKTMTNVYHLVSIYMKAIGSNQVQCWMLLSIMLDYVVSKLEDFKVDTSARDFGKFALSLEEMTLLFISHSGSRYTHSLQNYQLRSFQQSCRIIKEAYFAFDGYKDKSFVESVIKQSLVDYSLPGSGKHVELQKPFSSIRLYEITTNTKELAQLDEFLTIPENQKYDTNESIEELQFLVAPTQKSTLLDFDFDLA